MTTSKSPLIQELEADPRWLIFLSARLLGSSEGAEDLAQDAAALAVRASQRSPHADRDQARAWLATTVKHLALNARRRRGTERHARRDLDPQLMASRELSPADLQAKAEFRARVAALVLKLPDSEREAILLRFYEDKKGTEIQAALGASSQAAVRQRIARGVAKLRHSLDAESEERDWRHAAVLTAGATSQAPGTLKLAAAALGLAMLGGGLAGAWWLSSKGAASTIAEEAQIASLELDPGSAELAQAPPSTVVEASASGADREPAGTAVAPIAEVAAEGLRVQLLDEASGEPIPNYPWFLIPTGKLDYGREWGLGPQEPNPKPLASGVTDEEGYAVAPLSEYELVNLCTERSETYARGSWAIPIQGGESAVPAVTLGRGATIVGRVIDDSGAPVEGAQVYSRTYLDERISFGSTDADGRYRLPRCADFPRSFVLREDGEVEPTRTLPTAIGFARKGAPMEEVPDLYAAGHADVLVGQDAQVSAPDVVFPRLISIAGRVVDQDGRGIGGALVVSSSEHGFAARGGGLSPVRDQRPWDRPDFEPKEGQCLTDGSGDYTLHIPPPRHGRTSAWVAAYSPVGAVGLQDVPDATPGTPFDGVDFQLNEEETVRLYLDFPAASADEAIADAPEKAQLIWDLPEGRDEDVPARGRYLTLAFAANPELETDGDRTWLLLPHAHQPDRSARQGVLAGTLFLEGYETQHFELPKDATEATIPLVPLRRVTLRLEVDGPAARWLTRANVTVTSEAPDPARSVEDQVRRHSHTSAIRTKVYGWENGTERRVAVHGDRPVYAYVELFGTGRNTKPLPPFGPISLKAGEGGDALALKATLEEWPERGQSGAKPVAGDSSPSLSERRPTKILARVVSDSDGAFLESARVEATFGDASKRSYQRLWNGEERAVELNLSAESAMLRITHAGHYPKEIGPLALQPGGTTDLGDIRLDALDRVPCQLQTEDGQPAGAGYVVTRHDPDAGWARIKTDAEGRFDLFVGTSGPTALRIRHNEGSNDPPCTAIPELLSDGTARVVVPEWHPVRVRITGLAAPYCYAVQQLKLTSGAGPSEERPTSAVYNFPLLDGTDLIFHCHLPPGQWTVLPARPNFATFPAASVLVQPGASIELEPKEITVQASLAE